MSNFKERQEIELEAQRLTLQEQRNHIEILDTALINAQNNIMTLENEVILPILALKLLYFNIFSL